METCEFCKYCEKAFFDHFVCGLKVYSIQRKMLAEATLTLQEACAVELAEKETTVVHGYAVVNKVEVFLNVFDVRKAITPRKLAFIGKCIVMDATS